MIKGCPEAFRHSGIACIKCAAAYLIKGCAQKKEPRRVPKPWLYSAFTIASHSPFREAAHLSSCGSLDMCRLLKTLHDGGFDGYIRPDHGRMIWGETGRPGYGLYDRALGAAYLNGLWEAIVKAE